MRWFGFLFSVRFWIPIWIVILFAGLLPLPPAAELIILVGFVSHCVWFVQGRLRRAAVLRALARAEKAEEVEFRRQRRRRPPRDDTAHTLASVEVADPKHHGVFIGWAAELDESSK